MRALAIAEFGGPETLRLIELPEPEPGPGEVVIETIAAGVNFAEVLMRQGKMPGLPLPFVPGLEAAGRICALGQGVEGLKIGQLVIAFTRSAYAEKVAVDARLAAPVPEALGLSPRDVVGLACTGVTAYLLLNDLARLRPGEDVLIQGAVGGVGVMAVQVARALGARRVFGTIGSSSKRDFALSLGYDEVVLREDAPGRIGDLTGHRGVDVVLEGVSGDAVATDLGITAPLGRVVYFGDANFLSSANLSVQQLRGQNAGVLGFSLGGLTLREPDRWRPAAEALMDLMLAGRLKPVVSQTFAFDQGGEAHRALEGRQSLGKLVIDITAASGG